MASPAPEDLRIASRIAVFSGLRPETIDRLIAPATIVTLKQGDCLFHQGDAAAAFFIIVDGWATASRNGLTLAVLGPGSFFGELALLDGGDRTATVVADTDLTLLVLSRREFRSLQSTAPSVAYKLLVELGTRLRRADAMLADLAERDAAALAALSSSL